MIGQTRKARRARTRTAEINVLLRADSPKVQRKEKEVGRIRGTRTMVRSFGELKFSTMSDSFGGGLGTVGRRLVGAVGNAADAGS